jgi:hypothetical protein
MPGTGGEGARRVEAPPLAYWMGLNCPRLPRHPSIVACEGDGRVAEGRDALGVSRRTALQKIRAQSDQATDQADADVTANGEPVQKMRVEQCSCEPRKTA